MSTEETSTEEKQKHPLDDIRFEWSQDRFEREKCTATLNLVGTVSIDSRAILNDHQRGHIEDSMRAQLSSRFYGDAPTHFAKLQDALMKLECELPPRTIPSTTFFGSPSYDTTRNPACVQAEEALTELLKLLNR